MDLSPEISGDKHDLQPWQEQLRDGWNNAGGNTASEVATPEDRFSQQAKQQTCAVVTEKLWLLTQRREGRRKNSRAHVLYARWRRLPFELRCQLLEWYERDIATLEGAKPIKLSQVYCYEPQRHKARLADLLESNALPPDVLEPGPSVGAAFKAPPSEDMERGAASTGDWDRPIQSELEYVDREIAALDRYNRALERMPAELRPTLELKRSGLTNAVIAAQLGVSEATVRRQLKKVRRHLEKYLDSSQLKLLMGKWRITSVPSCALARDTGGKLEELVPRGIPLVDSDVYETARPNRSQPMFEGGKRSPD